MSSVMSHGFVPYIIRPTRITEYTTLIAHLFVRLLRDKLNVPVKAVILFNDITAHLSLFMFMSIQREGQSNQWPKVWIFIDTNIQKIVDKIASVNWCHILNHQCGNLNCSEYYKCITRFYLESFPLVQISVSKKRHKDNAWMTKGILKVFGITISYIANV